MTFQQQATDYSSYYRVGKQLGKGGNAIVYEATDIATGEKVALKVLSSSGAERVARFANEISVASKYSATISGILPVLKSSEKYCWYSMPVAESVMTALDNHKSKGDTTPFAVMTVIELAMTLDQLHAAGIHHRDIKPDNIYMYNGRACLGDFGLVEFPDSGNNLTRDNRGLGAIFTIAPEMKRNPKAADGAKADVYSLAKTLWMLLSGDTKGFDGQYNWLDDTHRLHSFEPLAGEYLVEIERLLHSATDNNPVRRPTMKELVLDLTEWTASRQSFDTRQNNEWDFLTDELFPGNKPQSTTFTRIDDIISVLTTVGRSPAYNHLLFSSGGGMDYTAIDKAAENGCVCIYTKPFYGILKPKALHMETFADSRWNYFLLEAEPLSPVLASVSDGAEELVEDVPGHYVDPPDSVYGVYDYDTGVKLPEGWRRVIRYQRGKFMLVSKTVPYNRIPQTYDGRHGAISVSELRKYVEALQSQSARRVVTGTSKIVVPYDANRSERNIQEPLTKEADEKGQSSLRAEGFLTFDISEISDDTTLETVRPTHLFTKQEIEAEMKKADDRKGNNLVIDREGYVRVIPMGEDCSRYPVRFESWGPRNNYVGRYSDLPTLDSDYHNALACWLRYLKTGTSQFCDTDCQCDERQTIDEITKLMNAASPASQTPQD